MQFDANNRPGSFRKTITVHTSIDDNFSSLLIKGYVIGTPNKLRKKIGILEADKNNLEFGNVIRGSSQTQEIKIHNTTEDTLHLSFADDPDGIEMEIEPEILYPSDYGKMVIHFNSENRNFGRTDDIILLNIEIAGLQTPGKIFIAANVLENFSTLSPEELANSPQISVQNNLLTLKNLLPGVLRTGKIGVENTGKRDLFIRNIQSSNKRFSIVPAEFSVRPGKKVFFDINVTPDNSESKLKTTLSIISNDPKQSVISFTIIGEVDLPEGKISNEIISEISIEKAKSLISGFRENDDFVIMDVRTEAEYSSGCIMGAVNIDFESSDFVKLLKLLDTRKTYLVYCKVGFRSAKAVNLMSEMGFKKIYHMKEGIDGWKALRLDLTDPNK